MGIYPINCPQCGDQFNWFSGNTTDQRCLKCKQPKESNMITEAQLIQALEGTIKAQDQLITYLKAEISRLNLIQNPIVQQYTPGIPQQIPPTWPFNPLYPTTPPWIVTSSGPLTTGNPGSLNPENNPPNSGWTTTVTESGSIITSINPTTMGTSNVGMGGKGGHASSTGISIDGKITLSN